MLLLRHVTNFLPLMIQMLMNDGIGHINMIRVIEQKIEELEKKVHGNEFKLMMLYLLLVDVKSTVDIEVLKKAIETIKIKALRSAIKYKMYYYIMFKCENNPHLERQIKSLIRKLSIDLNRDLDKGSLDKGFAQITKQQLLTE